MAFNYSAYSDSSDDSPHKGFAIKLSDIGGTADAGGPKLKRPAVKPETIETKELYDAFRNIDGPPEVLQNAVDRERRKSLLALNPPKSAKRPPPKPPSKSEDTSSIRPTRPPPVRRQLEPSGDSSSNQRPLSRSVDNVPYSPLKGGGQLREKRNDTTSLTYHLRNSEVISEKENPRVGVPSVNARRYMPTPDISLPLEYNRSEASQRGETEYLRLRIRQLEAEKQILEHRSLIAPAGEDSKPPSKSQDAARRAQEEEEEREKQFTARLEEELARVEEEWRARMKTAEAEQSAELAAARESFEAHIAELRTAHDRQEMEMKEDMKEEFQEETRRQLDALNSAHEDRIREVVGCEKSKCDEKLQQLQEGFRLKKEEEATQFGDSVRAFGVSANEIDAECVRLISTCRSEADIYSSVAHIFESFDRAFDVGVVQVWVLGEDGNSYHCMSNTSNSSELFRANEKVVASICSLGRDDMIRGVMGSSASATPSSSRRNSSSVSDSHLWQYNASIDAHKFKSVVDIISLPFQRRRALSSSSSMTAGGKRDSQSSFNPSGITSVHCAALANISLDVEDALLQMPSGFIIFGEEHSTSDVNHTDVTILSYIESCRKLALQEIIRKVRAVVSGSLQQMKALDNRELEKVQRKELELEMQVHYAANKLKTKCMSESLGLHGVADQKGLVTVELTAKSVSKTCRQLLGCTEAFMVLDVSGEDDMLDGYRSLFIISAADAVRDKAVQEYTRSNTAALCELLRCGGGSIGGSLPKPALISTTRKQLCEVGFTFALRVDDDHSITAHEESVLEENIQVLIVPFSISTTVENCCALVMVLSPQPVISQSEMFKYADILVGGFVDGATHIRKLFNHNLSVVGPRGVSLFSREIVPRKNSSQVDGGTDLDTDIAELLSIFSQEKLSELFNAEKCCLLIPNEVLTAQLPSTGKEAHSSYFVVRDFEDAVKRKIYVEGVYNNRWLDTLNNGKYIYLSSLSEVSKGKEDLYRFVRFIDADAKNSVLIPVHTSRGTCIFVLINSLSGSCSSDSTDGLHRSTLCPLAQCLCPTLGEIASALIDSQFCVAMSGMIESVCCAHEEISNRQTLIERLQFTVNKDANKINQLDSRYTMINSFQRWKFFCSQKACRLASGRISIFAISLKKLLDLSTCIPLELDKFHHVIESGLRQTFPSDVIILSDSEAMERGAKLVKKSLDGDQHSESAELRRKIMCLKTGKVVTFVTLVRTKTLKPFEEDEVGMVDSICQLAEIIYLQTRQPLVTSISSQTDTEEVVTYSSPPIIPFLLKMLPRLFPSTDLLQTGDQADWADSDGDDAIIVNDIVQWMKGLSGADVALLRIKPSDGSGREILISSEDTPILSPQESSRSAWKRCMEDLVVESSPPVEFSHSGNSQVVMRLLGVHGELKLIGSKEDGFERPFSEDTRDIAAIAAYLLSTSMLVRKKMSRFVRDAALTKAAVADLEMLVEEAQVQTDVEVNKVQSLGRRMALIRRLSEFSAELLSCRSLKEFGDLIWSSFPRAFGVKAANLFVRSGQNETDDFTAVLATSVSMGTQDSEFEDKISWSQLKKLPVFDRKLSPGRIAPSRRSKLLIVNHDTKEVIASILMLQEIPSDIDENCLDNDAIEESFCQIISQYISRMLIAQNFEQEVATKKVSLEKYEQLYEAKASAVQELESLQEDMSRLMEDLSKGKKEKEQLGSKLKTLGDEYAVEKTTLTQRCEQFEAALQHTEEEFEQRLHKLNQQYVTECTRSEEIENSLHQMESMVMGFAVDTRLQPQHVLGWMYEFADKFGTQVHSVCRSAGGELMVSSGGAGSVSSAVCGTAADAIRDCKPVEVLASMSDSHSLSSMRTTGRVHNPVVILCVPNRLTTGGNLSESHTLVTGETVCFAFVRHGDQKFSSFEKSFLNCIVGIASKTMAVYEGAKQKYPENIERVISLAAAESAQVARLKNAVAISTKQWSIPFKSWNELVAVAEGGGRSILTFKPPSSNIPSDKFVVECCVWQPGTKSLIHSQSHANPARSSGLLKGSFENDIVAHRVLTNGRSHRNGNMLWVPLKSSTGETIAILFAERKIDFRRMPQDAEYDEDILDARVSRVDPSGTHFTTHSPSEMLFSELEEEMLNIFSSMAAGAVHRLIMQEETLQSVQKASKAILSLQSSQAMLEHRLAQEVAYKLKFEEAMKMGSEVISSVIVKRMELSVMLDMVRKALVTLVSSRECFIVTPFIPEDAFNSGKQESPGERMFTLASENGETVEVKLEPMDIEYVALKTRRPCKSSGVGEQQSWAARNCLIEKWSVPADMEAPRTDAVLYALAVPCLLRNGSTVVVVVLRHNHDYDSTDEMCMFWLTKILGCSIDMHQDECDVKYFRDRLAVTEEELSRAHDECELISEQLTLKLNQSLERNQEAELSCLKSGLARLSAEVRDALKFSEDKAPLFDYKTFEENGHIIPSCLDVLAYCAETTFIQSQVEVWSSSEAAARSQDMNALLLDTKERVNKDSITIGNTKIVLWEESAMPYDGHGAAMHIKAVITNPELFESPAWVKIKKHENECPDIYKVKLLFMMKSMFNYNLHHLQVRDLLHRANLSRENIVMAHSQEIEAMERDMYQQISMHKEELSRSRAAVEDARKDHNSDLAATKTKYKTATRELLKEHLVVNDYLNKIAIAEKFILGCGTLTRSEDKKTPKKLNLVKMIRKVCEVLNQDGLLDVAAAQVRRVTGADQGRKSQAAALETTHLTWISPSTHWVGTSSPLTSTSPLGTAYVSKRLVMTVTSEGSRAKILEEGEHHHPKIEINPNDYVIMVTEALPERTLIVPVTFLHHEEEFLIVVKPIGEGVEKVRFAPPPSLSLSSWSTIRTCLITAATLNHTIHFEFKQRRIEALTRVMIQSNSKIVMSRLRELARGFSCLKTNWMTDRLSAYSYDDHKYAVARKRIRVLERSVADWTELVKGVNGASSGVALGLPGLWGQACRPLMSMITSHVTLRGCGLMVASEDGEVMDLNVEALSSLDDIQQDYYDRNDVAATVSIRPATEMGASLQSLALNILNGQTMASDRGSVQRLWKLSRTEGKGMRYGINEQMWLVPLRTATEVLGIVRVFVDVSSDDSKHEHDRHDYGEFQDYSEESSTEYGWGGGGSESAKRNLINFAEVLAPLVTATRLIETSQSREQTLEEDVREKVRNQHIFRKEVDLLMRRVHLVSTSVEEVHRALATDFSEEEISIGLFNALGQRLEMPLSIALGVDVKMLSGDIRADEVRDEAAFKVYLSEITINKGDVVGYLRALIPLHADHMDANMDSIVFDDVTLNIADSFTAPSPSHMVIDEATVAAVLDTVAASISTMYLNFQRELEAREKVTRAVENLHTMQHELDDQIQLRQEFSYKEVISSETSAFNLKIADIMRACAACDSSYSWEEAEINSIAQQVHEKSDGIEIGHSAQKLLKNLCEELATLFGRDCVFNVGVQKHIPVLEDSSDDLARIAATHRKLVWYSAEGHGELHLPRGLVAADRIQIVENLAASCISCNRKSCIDIELEQNSSSLGALSAATMKVLTYPLIPPLIGTASDAIGVLQVLLPSHFDKSEVEQLCEDVCGTIAGVLRNDRARTKLFRRIHDFTTANSILTVSLEEATRDSELWRQKFTSWNAVALALKGLAQDCQESRDGMYKLLPTDMRAMLKSYGITLVASKSDDYDSDDSGVSQSGKEGYSFVLQNDLNGDTSEMLVICRFNNDTIPSEDHEPLFEVLREYICCLHNLIIARKLLVEEHEKTQKVSDSKIRESQHQVALANDQCRILSEKLQIASSAVNEQSNRITSMKGRIPRVIQGVLQPLSGDINNLMLVDSNEDKSVELSTPMIEMFFNRFASVISTSVGRMLSKPSRPFHVSVLVKTVLPGKGSRAKQFGTGVVMFDGAHTTGATYSDSEFEDENSSTISSESAVHRSFYTGESHSTSCLGKVYGLPAFDLIGITAHQLNALSIDSTGSKSSKEQQSTVMVVPLHTDISGLVAVTRIVYSGEVAQGDGSVNVDEMLVSVANLLCSLSRSLARTYYDHQKRSELQTETIRLAEEGRVSTEGVQHQLSRFRKIYKVVSREINCLFDPPVLNVSVNGVLQKLPSHPAALSPLVALQDTCLKMLSVVRSLAHSEGQAILLKDPDSTANTYQIIFTGNALSWTGINAGSFGMVSTPASTPSLTRTCINSHKSILVADATVEKSYSAGIDGTCLESTPMMLLPIRGRGGGVVGVLIAARTYQSRPFTVEDVVAVELACSFGSLSLFWSSGLGYIHQKLSSSVSKIEELEKSVKAIQKNPAEKKK